MLESASSDLVHYFPYAPQDKPEWTPLKKALQAPSEKQSAVSFGVFGAVLRSMSSLTERLLDKSAGLTPLIETELEWLDDNEVEFEELAEIRDYLLRFPDLLDLIPEVCTTVVQRFGKDAQLSLKVRRDPGLEDGLLALYVRLKQYDDQVMDKIEDIRLEYSEELNRRRGWLLITTDFRLVKS